MAKTGLSDNFTEFMKNYRAGAPTQEEKEQQEKSDNNSNSADNPLDIWNFVNNYRTTVEDIIKDIPGKDLAEKKKNYTDYVISHTPGKTIMEKAQNYNKAIEDSIPGKNALEKARYIADNKTDLQNTFIESLRYIVDGMNGVVRDEDKEEIKEETKEETPAENPEVKPTAEASKPIEENVVEYVYKPGDTFGQVIKNLGLNTDAGLWGANGDVAYYTQQLIDQGIWPDNVAHNIPIGTKIRLKRRK